MKTEKISQEEILELVWVLREKKDSRLSMLVEKSREENPEKLVNRLVKDGYLLVENDNIIFTTDGEKYAESIIRRLRLAEVLFAEILEMEDNVVRDQACEFEHILMTEVTESICTFLGHPRKCPHGLAIPHGECCATFRSEIKPLVQPLSDLKIGDDAKVVFMSPKTHTRLDKLITFGLTPGSTIKLHQKQPSFVIQIGETDLALDNEIAKNIYVKRISGGS